MTKDLPSVDLLRKLLRYEPETGKLFWRERGVDVFSSSGHGGRRAAALRWNARFANAEAMTEVRDGYLRGKIFGKKVSAHRVIWAMQTGDWPDDQIDHINGIRDDNRWENLREATSRQNSWNSMPTRPNKTGFLGVTYDRRSGKYTARIIYTIGPFSTPEEASSAYIDAKKAICGKFMVNRT